MYYYSSGNQGQVSLMSVWVDIANQTPTPTVLSKANTESSSGKRRATAVIQLSYHWPDMQACCMHIESLLITSI